MADLRTRLASETTLTWPQVEQVLKIVNDFGPTFSAWKGATVDGASAEGPGSDASGAGSGPDAAWKRVAEVYDTALREIRQALGGTGMERHEWVLAEIAMLREKARAKLKEMGL